MTYAAVFHFVAASYVVIFSVGKNNPEMAYVLGLVAVVEALLCWTIGFACRRASHAWTKECGWPLDHWAIVLTGVAILLSDRSPLVLGLVGLAFLLMVKGRPRVEWLYGTVAALVAASYFEWFSTASRPGWMAFATLTAFALWGLGVLIQRIQAGGLPAAGTRLARL